MTFTGTWVALSTGFDGSGELDAAATVTHARWLAGHGVAGLLVGGTAGEGPSLATDEQLALVAAVAATGVPVLATCTTGARPDAVRFVRESAARGAAGVVVLPPHYYRPVPDEALVRWFAPVVAAAGIPVIAYHVPRLAVPVPPAVVAALPLWGVKDSGGDLAVTGQVLRAGRGVLLGTEQDLAAGLATGAHGLVSALANVVPELLVALVAAPPDRRAELAGHARALRTASKLHPSVALLKVLARDRHGIALGSTRPPLAELGDVDLGPVRELVTAALDAATTTPAPPRRSTP
jgi:dihydrodipicolinate synthase/N-acetylneuraminate lyase